MAKHNDGTAETEDMVTVIIDPKLTNGGLRTATATGWKNYVGKVKVPESLGEDLLRRQTEYAATVAKLNDPSVSLRNQNIDITRKQFMADPGQYGQRTEFSKENGLASRFQMSFISKQDLAEWKEEREGLFGY